MSEPVYQCAHCDGYAVAYRLRVDVDPPVVKVCADHRQEHDKDLPPKPEMRGSRLRNMPVAPATTIEKKPDA